MRQFTSEEKAKEARREVALRRHVYARKVAAGEMGERQAMRLISIMLEIADEYEQAMRQDRRDLFNAPAR